MTLRAALLFASSLIVPALHAADAPVDRSSFVALGQPCRVFDTRLTSEGPLQTGEPRNFRVKGDREFPTQGGTDGGCGVSPDAVAAVINFVAINPSGAGNLKGAAYPNEIPATGSIINYQALTPNLNVANGLAFPLCDSSLGECDFDIVLQPNGAGVQVVGDVVAYYLRGVVSSLTPAGGLTGGGVGDVTISLAPQGVSHTHLAPNAVTSGAIQDAAVTGTKISNNQIVRSINNVKDLVTITGAGGATVSTSASTITITGAAPLPAGAVVEGYAGDTTLVGAGYTELGPSGGGLWGRVSTTNIPTMPFDYSIVWTGSHMIIWGGRSSSAGLIGVKTGGRYDPVTDSWNPTDTTTAPPARHSHTAVWTGSEMIIWGGDALDPGQENSGGRYNSVTNAWTPTSTVGTPLERFGHTAVWTDGVMVVWGGISGGYQDTGGQYDPIADLWTPTSPTNAPSARHRHTAIWTGSRMIVWGGQVGVSTFSNTGGIYDPVADTWIATSTLGFLPAARADHSAVWTGSEMIIRGGRNTSGDVLGDGSMLKSQWVPMSSDGAPSSRSNHAAVWTGSRMVIWGSDGYTLTGATYNPATQAWTGETGRNGVLPIGFPAAVWTGSEMLIYGRRGAQDTSLPSMIGARWRPFSYYRKN